MKEIKDGNANEVGHDSIGGYRESGGEAIHPKGSRNVAITQSDDSQHQK